MENIRRLSAYDPDAFSTGLYSPRSKDILSEYLDCPGPTMLILLQATAFGPCLDFPVGSGHGLERIRASYRERIPVH